MCFIGLGSSKLIKGAIKQKTYDKTNLSAQFGVTEVVLSVVVSLCLKDLTIQDMEVARFGTKIILKDWKTEKYEFHWQIAR